MADELTDALSGPRQLKEPGSPAWCLQTVRYLKAHVRHVDEQWRQAEQVLDELVKAQAWRKIPLGQPYGTLNKMLKAEVGLDGRAIKRVIQEARDLASRGGDRRSADFQSNNITLDLDRGTSEIYTIRRLKRDYPELAKRVEQGELTANAAAIEAGFRPRTISVPVTRPEAVANSLLKYMKPDDVLKLIAILVSKADA